MIRRVAKPFQKNICIYPNGHLVSRSSDYIIYSVEAEAINRVVAQYGPCMLILF
jgi:prephenate dehydrogenase (NADP+)